MAHGAANAAAWVSSSSANYLSVARLIAASCRSSVIRASGNNNNGRHNIPARSFSKALADSDCCVLWSHILTKYLSILRTETEKCTGCIRCTQQIEQHKKLLSPSNQQLHRGKGINSKYDFMTCDASWGTSLQANY